MFDSPHVDPTHHYDEEMSHGFETHSGYPRAYPEYHEWSDVSPRHHTPYYLSSTLTPEENEYLALYGASELFGQLASMEPRKPRKKRTTPKRNGIFHSNSDDEDSTESDSESSSTPAPASNFAGYSMNLFGSGELVAQLQSENGLERTKKRWTPKYKNREDFELNALQ